jgi:hypothetical protein
MFNKLKSFFLELPNNGRNKFRTHVQKCGEENRISVFNLSVYLCLLR